MRADARRDSFLIDGFPRNKDNLDGWTRQMGEKVDLQFVLFFDCDEEVNEIYLCQNGVYWWWFDGRQSGYMYNCNNIE